MVNTHEDGDHVWGNQLFKDAEIIAHRSMPEAMKRSADPDETLKLQHAVEHYLTRMLLKGLHPGVAAVASQLHEDFDFEGIELTLPTTLFDTRYELDLDGTAVHILYVGPCHSTGDTIVHVPKEGVLFAGDVLFHDCTPMGWVGTYQKWFDTLDLMEQLAPEVIVPGHGPVCGLEGVRELRSYLQHLHTESRKYFDAGLSATEAAKRIEIGPYADWHAPARVYMNVERAYREFRNEPPNTPWDHAKVFDSVYMVAKAKGVPVEY